MTKKRKILLGIVFTLFAIIYFFTGLFVIQPIGAVPDGATIWYLRTNTNLPFISSADSVSLDRVGSVSLLTRGMVLANVATMIENKVIIRLPYIDFLYSISTNGAEFDR